MLPSALWICCRRVGQGGRVKIHLKNGFYHIPVHLYSCIPVSNDVHTIAEICRRLVRSQADLKQTSSRTSAGVMDEDEDRRLMPPPPPPPVLKRRRRLPYPPTPPPTTPPTPPSTPPPTTPPTPPPTPPPTSPPSPPPTAPPSPPRRLTPREVELRRSRLMARWRVRSADAERRTMQH